MQVREQPVGADMDKPEFSDGRRRDEAQDQTASCSEEGVETDAWTSLIAEGRDNPGLFFKAPVLQRLAVLKTERFDSWVNLRARFKRDCPDLPIRDLDRAVDRCCEDGSAAFQGQAIDWPDPEPWPDPVDGAALLEDISAHIRRYVHVPPEAADAVALWIVQTWVHRRLELSAFLNVTSATKRCGKSLLLETMAPLLYRPTSVSGRITPASLFRLIERHEPTLLIDEADTFFRDAHELRGIVNGSHRRDLAYVVRCVGEDHEPRKFTTWSPKVICGIGGLPDTVHDRSLVIRLARRPARLGALPCWRDRDREAIDILARKIARWIGDRADGVLARRRGVAFPPGLHDRARDNWEALLAIADCAGGQWAGRDGRAWHAAEAIGIHAREEDSDVETLLADVFDVFREAGDPPALATRSILERLNGMDHRPWPEWTRGNPLTAHGLARLLTPFGIVPGTIRTEGIGTAGGTAKGYKRSAFAREWVRYSIGDTPDPSVTRSQSAPDKGFGGSSSVTSPESVTDPQPRKPSNRNDCDVVTAAPSLFPLASVAFELNERADKARRRAAAREANGSSPDGLGRP